MGSAPVSIRRYLMLIVLSALLPMGLFAGCLLYFLWDHQQNLRNQEQLARVRTLASLVEGELQSTVARLRLLVLDPQLEQASLAAFHQRLRRVLSQSDDWSNLVLIAPDRQLLDASLPYGSDLPDPIERDFQRRAMETGAPAISDLFETPGTQAQTVGVAVPVLREGRAAFVLVATLRLGQLNRRLASVVPADGVAGLFDRSRRFIARSRHADPYIGKPPGRLLFDAIGGDSEGVIRSTTREGEGTFTAFSRLTDGWTLAVATPSAPRDWAFARYLAMLIGAWLAMLLIGLLMTRFLTARINRNVAATVETAERLAAGHQAEFPRAAVAELAALSDAVRRLFQRERHARAQAETANQAKDEFLAMLGHELRNPLAPISTALQLMRTRGSDVFAKEREVIQRQVQHMVRLVDDLLDVARIARGAVELKKTTIEISTLVSEALETVEPFFRRKRLKLSVSVPEHGLKVHGDPARLMQVLSNLLNNAAKFTGEDGAVAVRALARDGQVELSVADDGAGIDPAELPRVFELFTQGQQSVDRPRGGLGLGLAIARSLARLHGGDLVGASEGRGKGSVFKLRLPHLSGEQAPVESPGPAAASPIVAADKLVMIVDDNVDAAVGLAELLRLWGFRTMPLHDGREVIAAIREASPDIVLLDIGLPGIDGYQLAWQIRQEPQWRQLLLIALTGFGQTSDRDRSRRAGFDLHLVKPVDLDHLAAALGASPDGQQASPRTAASGLSGTGD